MRNIDRYFKARAQKGFVLSYVLFSIAILAALATAYASMSRSKTQAEVTAQAVDRITTAFGTVRSRIHSCIAGSNSPLLVNFYEPDTYDQAPLASLPAIEVVNMGCPLPTSPDTLIQAQGPLILPPSGFYTWFYIHDKDPLYGPAIVILPTTVNAQAAIRTRVLNYFNTNYAGLVLAAPPGFTRSDAIFLNVQ